MSTFEKQGLCGNPSQRFGSVLEPDPEPTREFGPIANTRQNADIHALIFAIQILSILTELTDKVH